MAMAAYFMTQATCVDPEFDDEPSDLGLIARASVGMAEMHPDAYSNAHEPTVLFVRQRRRVRNEPEEDKRDQLRRLIDHFRWLQGRKAYQHSARAIPVIEMPTDIDWPPLPPPTFPRPPYDYIDHLRPRDKLKRGEARMWMDKLMINEED